MQRSYFRNRKPKTKASEPSKRRKLDEMDFWSLVKILDAEFIFNLRAGKAARQGHPFVKCYTCGAQDHWKNMDCGHYVGREYFGVRWDARNTRIQCTKCNCFAEGEKAKYRINLEQEGVNVNSVTDLADFYGKTHPPIESLMGWIKEYREENAVIRNKIKGME